MIYSDNAGGMPPEVARKIFDPFFTTKSRNEGTGLGMSIVHGIVKSLRGQISVSSVPGTGSTFELRFPLGAVQLEPGRPRILVVDDEPEICELLADLLSSGFETLQCTRSTEVAKLLEFQAFSAVVCDFQMPEVTGRGVYEVVLRQQPNCAFVLCTGYSLTSVELAALDADAKKFVIRKPFPESTEMQALVSRAISEKRQSQEIPKIIAA